MAVMTLMIGESVITGVSLSFVTVDDECMSGSVVVALFEIEEKTLQ